MNMKDSRIKLMNEVLNGIKVHRYLHNFARTKIHEN